MNASKYKNFRTQCHNCGDPIFRFKYEIRPGRKNYCSKPECVYAMRMNGQRASVAEKLARRITVFCVHCGRPFEKAKTYAKTCCSSECHILYITNIQRKFSPETYQEKPCKFCGKMFFNRRKPKSEFCSGACVGRWSLSNMDRSRVTEDRAKKMRGMKWPISDVIKRATPMAGREATHPLHKKSPDNINAHWWCFRNPRGIVFQFRNLNDFVRNNPGLFNDEDVAWRRTIRGDTLLKNKTVGNMSCRAVKGLAALYGKGKVVPGSWKGWTAVVEWEHKEGDLLERVDVELKPAT